MPHKIHNPANAPKPASAYSQGIEAPAGARWLHISGQVGTTADGRTGEGFAAQAELAWRSLIAVLESASMGVGDLVKITTYVTDPRYVPDWREVRDRYQGAHRPASTLVVVAGLAHPAWLVEIEAVAAKG